MKNTIRIALAALMLAGLYSAAVQPAPKATKGTVMMADGGDPAPLCRPSVDPNCKPPIGN